MSWQRISASSVLILALGTAPLAADWSTGVAAFQAGDLAAAESHFRVVIDANPDWAGGYRMMGQTLLRDGRTAAAVPWLQRAVELAPGDVPGALVLGQALVLARRFDDAVEVLARREPHGLPSSQKVTFYEMRAMGRIGIGDPAAALADLERALELRPASVKLHGLSAQAAESSGRRDLAIDHWAEVSELEPADLRSRSALTRLLYERALEAEPAQRAGACLEATASARRLTELDGSFDVKVLYARAAACAGNHEEAREAARAASVLDAEAWWPFYLIGRSEIGLGRWSEAAAAFERGLALEVPQRDELRLRRNLGYALERQNQLREALIQYRLAADEQAVARVERNRQAEDEARRLRELEEEAARLEAELAELNGGFR